MAPGLLSILKIVPWGEVINNAPKVADGAMKLWRAVAKRPPASEVPISGEQPALAGEALSLVALQAQLAAAEAKLTDLHEQMLVSSELIKALADQNTQLIKRIEVNRIRVLLLAGIMVVLVVVAVINLALTFAR